MFHYRTALDVIVSAAGALWLMSAGSGSVPDTQPFLGAYLHDRRLINCLGYESESYYSVFLVIEGWPVLSLAWWLLGSAPEPPTVQIPGQRNLLKHESVHSFPFNAFPVEVSGVLIFKYFLAQCNIFDQSIITSKQSSSLVTTYPLKV